MKKIFLSAFISFVGVQASSFAADILVSNISNSQSEEDIFSDSSSLFQSFQTGSTSATIQQIEFMFGFLGNPSGVNVDIYNDANGKAGSLLSSFARTNVVPDYWSASIFTGSLLVSANSNYWVVLSMASVDGAPPYGYVAITDDSSQNGTNGWSLADSHYLGDILSPIESAGTSIKMKISGVVPEPSTFSLFALGLGGMAFRRRRS